MFVWHSPHRGKVWARLAAAPNLRSGLLTSHRRRHLGDPLLGFLDDLERLLDGGQRVNSDVDDSGEGQVRNDIAESSAEPTSTMKAPARSPAKGKACLMRGSRFSRTNS